MLPQYGAGELVLDWCFDGVGEPLIMEWSFDHHRGVSVLTQPQTTLDHYVDGRRISSDRIANHGNTTVVHSKAGGAVQAVHLPERDSLIVVGHVLPPTEDIVVAIDEEERKIAVYVVKQAKIVNSSVKHKRFHASSIAKAVSATVMNQCKAAMSKR